MRSWVIGCLETFSNALSGFFCGQLCGSDAALCVRQSTKFLHGWQICWARQLDTISAPNRLKRSSFWPTVLRVADTGVAQGEFEL
jgi:hypothetical protein